jgi:hypothetical protein
MKCKQNKKSEQVKRILCVMLKGLVILIRTFKANSSLANYEMKPGVLIHLLLIGLEPTRYKASRPQRDTSTIPSQELII